MRPHFCVDKTSFPKDKRIKDHMLNKFVKDEFRDPLLHSYGMARPNLKAERLDTSKFNRDLSRAAKFDEDIYRQAVDLTIQLLQPAFGDRKYGAISLEEACLHLTRTTSPGWPWNRRWMTKGDLIDHVPMHAHVDRVMKGGSVFWAVSGKEEPKAIDKLNADNIRGFVCGPIELNLMGIMATHRWKQDLVRNWRKIPVTEGIDIFHGGWEFLVRRRRFESFPSDRPKWDASFLPQGFDAINEIISSFLDDEAKAILRRVQQEHRCGPILMRNGKGGVRWVGEPSGGSLTIEENSVFNLFTFVYSIIDLRRQSGLTTSFEDFSENVDIDVHGDDTVHGASPSWVRWCLPSVLNAYWESKGWKFFMDNWDDSRFDPSQAEYLSMTTAIVRGAMLPRLKGRAKILASLVLGAKKAVPKTMSEPEYHLSRAWQICNVTYADQEFWKRLVTVVEKYEKYLFSKHGPNDASLHRGAKYRRSDKQLFDLFTKEALPSKSVFEGLNLDMCFPVEVCSPEILWDVLGRTSALNA